jgi:YbgC/YbaW family acyl-CoA thioester hydrolase
VFYLESYLKVEPKNDDIDMIGHINNVKYAFYLEKGRKKWYADAGFTVEEKINRKIGTVVKRLEIIFLKEARFGDRLEIVTKPQKLGNTSFVLKQEIYNQYKELLTEATVTLVTFDLVKRKSIPVVDEIACHFADLI